METQKLKKVMTISSANRTNKILATTMILVIAVSAFVTIFPAVFAQTILPAYTPMPDRDTQTEVGLSPNFVGVGQEVTVNIITYPAPSGPTYEAQSLVPNLH